MAYLNNIDWNEKIFALTYGKEFILKCILFISINICIIKFWYSFIIISKFKLKILMRPAALSGLIELMKNYSTTEQKHMKQNWIDFYSENIMY